MKFIGHNSDIINYLINDLSLLNAIVKNFKVHEIEGTPAISMMLELAYTDADVMLTFKNIVTNGFTGNPADELYEVDSCKFYHFGSNIYFCIDPDESEEGVVGISKNDNDFVLCKSVEGYIFEDVDS